EPARVRLNAATSRSRSARPIPRLNAFTVVPGRRSSLIPSPFKSIPPTYALNGGVFVYAKLTDTSSWRGNRRTPAMFRVWVRSVGSGPVFSSKLSRLNPEPALAPLFPTFLAFVPVLLEYAY